MKKDLLIEFLGANAGWMPFRIIAADKSWTVNASYWLDPFPDLIAWLEEIIEGSHRSELFINEESSGTILRYERINQTLSLFKVDYTDVYGDVHPFLSLSLKTRDLVSEFYNRLMDYSRSDTYDKRQWETDSFLERFLILLDLQSYEELEDFLIQYHSEQIFDMCGFINPPRYVMEIAKKRLNEYIHNSIPGNPEHNLAILNQLKNDDYFDQNRFDFVEDHRPTDGFETSDLQRKKKLLKNLLNEMTYGYTGFKLSDRRSLKIENWLKDHEEKENNDQ